MAYIGKSPTAAPLTSSDVADGIITNAKLAQDIISADTALGAEPADTDELLVSDAGTLKRMDYSHIKPSSTLVKIAAADYSSGVANFTITDCFSATYPIYKVYLYNVLAAADDNDLLTYLLEDDDSVVGNFQTTSDGAYIQYASTTAGQTSSDDEGLDHIRFTGNDLQSEATKISALEMTIYQPYESVHTTVHWNFILNSDNDHLYKLNGLSYLQSTTSIRSIKFQTSAGTNFSSYKTVVFGVKTS